MFAPDVRPDEAAVALLGARLEAVVAGVHASIILNEVEAYGGADDAASHARNGLTTRNAAMFGPAGTLYVYLSYGMHWCVNIATGPAGEGSAVLLRGGLPDGGIDVMVARRGRTTDLTDGPGKLSQALGIDSRFDGMPFAGGRWSAGGGDELRLELGVRHPSTITATPRVGISREKDRAWRFVATF